MAYENDVHERPVTQCDDRCACSVRVGTWNINHLSSSTKNPKKSEAKLKAIEQLCTKAGLDCLVLQEVNATARSLPGLNKYVVRLGPLLKSESEEGRLQFLVSFPAGDNPNSNDKTIRKRQAIFYEWLEQGNRAGAYKAWAKQVKARASALKSKSSVERVNAAGEIAKSQPAGEAIYHQFRRLRDRYQEYYPLLASDGERFKVTAVRLFWGDGRITDVTKDGETVYFRSPRLKGGLTDQPQPEPQVPGKEFGARVDKLISDSKNEDKHGRKRKRSSSTPVKSGSDKEKVDDDEDNLQDEDNDVESTVEFRPVVVYTITRPCPAKKKACSGIALNLGVVHTSPAGTEFKRVAIYKNQLEKVFAKVAEEGGNWILAGDYYLTAEAIVVASKASYLNVSRNVKNLTFERQLPKELQIVAAVTGTNSGTWRPKPDRRRSVIKQRFSSQIMQVADFAVCSRTWPFCRAVPLDPASGAPMLLDENHHVFRTMRSTDSSDHSPVLIFAGSDDERTQKDFAALLRYKPTQEKSVQSEQTAFTERRAAFSKQNQELKKRINELEATSKKSLPAVEAVKVAREHRQLVQQYVSINQKPSGVSLFDFQPS